MAKTQAEVLRELTGKAQRLNNGETVTVQGEELANAIGVLWTQYSFCEELLTLLHVASRYNLDTPGIREHIQSALSAMENHTQTTLGLLRTLLSTCKPSSTTTNHTVLRTLNVLDEIDAGLKFIKWERTVSIY